MILSAAKGACLPRTEPRDWHAQTAAQPTHSPGQGSAHMNLLFLLDLPRGPAPDPVPFSCSILLREDLSCNFGCTESFWWFLLVFCENCSMCRHIFDVFVGRSELYILLLCHLDPSWTEFLLGKEKAFLEEGMSWVKAEARIAKFIFSKVVACCCCYC